MVAHIIGINFILFYSIPEGCQCGVKARQMSTDEFFVTGRLSKQKEKNDYLHNNSSDSLSTDCHIKKYFGVRAGHFGDGALQI